VSIGGNEDITIVLKEKDQLE